MGQRPFLEAVSCPPIAAHRNPPQPQNLPCKETPSWTVVCRTACGRGAREHEGAKNRSTLAASRMPCTAILSLREAGGSPTPLLQFAEEETAPEQGRHLPRVSWGQTGDRQD